ncbi:DUF2945 domain-containing protein [Caulobacter endophyticus]|uniref:DUF2945 domain-containing protein n=1 Tax=Caulobacter endophyticus TaxID=2172652 RepID=UPI00240ED78B|nr:DUF2945 domain-containing protein [Caulobacter endophyticus]MDG2530120.1 DUF2945 domain-containing protein [Caulobacter endophyticus]
MARHFSERATVTWRWGAHEARGKVLQRFDRRVTRTIKGEKITRNGSPEEPAYLVGQADGGRVLKSESELSAHDPSR